MERKLNEYLNAIDKKDPELIKHLNIKYSQNDINEIILELYNNKSLDQGRLKNIIYISLIYNINFDVTSKLIVSLIKNNDITSLKIIINNILYDNSFIRKLLHLYKCKKQISTNELNTYCDNERKKVNLNEIIKEDQNTPLISACRQGNEEIVKLLIRNGANVNKENIHGFTPLIEACQCNRKNIVKILIDQGAEVNKGNINGDTPLIIAFRYGYSDIIKILIKNGADVNKENVNGVTPLLIECERRNEDNVKLLIENGANVNKENKKGDTPLLIARKNGYTNIYNIIIEEKIKSKESYKSSHYDKILKEYLVAIEMVDANLIKDLNKIYSYDKITEIIIDLYDSKKIDDNSIKKLIYMSFMNDIKFDITSDLLISMIQRNDINSLNIIFDNILYDNDFIKRLLYIYKRKYCLTNTEIENICLDDINKINLNELTKDNEYTPLLFACEKEKEEIVEYLIENGADIDKGNNTGDTPLIISCKKGNDNIVNYLINNGANINKENEDGDTPLMIAFNKENEDLIETLIENGADVDVENKKGDIPLIIACQKNNEDMVDYLIENGADVNKENINGDTAIMKVCENGSEKLEKNILEMAAGINNDYNESPMFWSINSNNESIFDILFKKRLEITKKNKNKSNSYFINANKNKN
ncbi:hypothetical protein PIROE2DRAFT_64118 [Piromyces sp. E2]|nr:hypothetical protein PIROE2DRAFT_64118 [Piromyces sp. E2]|eukprot:OUM58897.1 hypothetical protein PIROE2DRAFT_64118 [Piromyces sp. E2]